MQGRNKIFLDVMEDLISFQAKMKLWMHQIEGGRIAAFPASNAFVEEEFDIKNVCGIFLEHRTSFLSELDRYIPSKDFCKALNWVQIPFEVAALQVHSEIDCVGEQLVVLQSRQMWNEKYENLSLTQFWASVQLMEPNVSELC